MIETADWIPKASEVLQIGFKWESNKFNRIEMVSEILSLDDREIIKGGLIRMLLKRSQSRSDDRILTSPLQLLIGSQQQITRQILNSTCIVVRS